MDNFNNWKKAPKSATVRCLAGGMYYRCYKGMWQIKHKFWKTIFQCKPTSGGQFIERLTNNKDFQHKPIN